MTSVLRRYAQIEPRIQYFTPLDVVPGCVLNGSAASSPVMDISGFQSAFDCSASQFDGTHLLKDLGRQITVYNSNVAGDPHVALFRQVMEVNGPNREGISTNIAYICVWADGGTEFSPAPVARTG